VVNSVDLETGNRTDDVFFYLLCVIQWDEPPVPMFCEKGTCRGLVGYVVVVVVECLNVTLRFSEGLVHL